MRGHDLHCNAGGEYGPMKKKKLILHFCLGPLFIEALQFAFNNSIARCTQRELYAVYFTSVT